MGVFYILAAILLSPQATLAVPTMTPYEDGIEGGTVVDLDVDSMGNGVATIGRQCKGCGPIQLKVTPLSRVVVGGRQVPIRPDTKLKGRIGDVFYVIKEKRLTRIRLY
jgi:hypothetical protein